MYVLVSDNSVLNGPKPWSPRSFQNTLNDLNIDYILPLSKTDGAPIFITDTVKILPAVLDESTPYNPKIEYLHGPFWDFTGNVATGTYIAQSNHIDAIKGSFKEIVTANRYKKEVSGVSCVIQNTSITLDTSRENRGNYIQRYVIMQQNDTIEWKFNNTWLNLTKDDMNTICQAVSSHIQSQFDWEANKHIEIDLASNLQELDAINLE